MSRTALAPQALACVVGIALLIAAGNPALAQVDSSNIGLEFEPPQAAPEINARFRPLQGWIGGEGGHSVDLGNNRTLWLYGDTWVGTIKEGRRSNARIVHNSAGVQCSADAPCSFVVRENENHKAIDLISPVDGKGWLWFQAATMVHGRLYLFMSQFERSSSFSGQTHQQIAQWLGVVANPLDDPRDWCVEQTQIPYSVFSNDRAVTYGSATVVHEGYLYVYGCDDCSPRHSQNRFLVLARVPLDQIVDLNAWRFFRKGRWSRDHSSPTRLADYMSTDATVAYMPGLDQFLMVYTDAGVSPRIVARTAPKPSGPWSDMETIHHCRDAVGDSKLFSYGGAAHPTLSSDGKLVISYLTSSVDTWQVAMNARLYWPTFVTVDIRDARPPQSIGRVADAETGGQ